jgi:hypothetical protein
MCVLICKAGSVLTDHRALHAASQWLTDSRNRSSGNSQIFGRGVQQSPGQSSRFYLQRMRLCRAKNELTERAYPAHLSNFTFHLMELRRRRVDKEKTIPSLADLRSICGG